MNTPRITLSMAFLMTMAMALCACNDVVRVDLTEPDAHDQLLPIHSGASWSYAGNGAAAPEMNPPGAADGFAPKGATRLIQAWVRDHRGASTRDAMAVYADAEHIWHITPEGVYIGVRESEDRGTLTGFLPRTPTLGAVYGDLRCDSIEPVSVAAGTFTCYRFRDVRDHGRCYWFARGVGLVRRSVDVAGVRQERELAAYQTGAL